MSTISGSHSRSFSTGNPRPSTKNMSGNTPFTPWRKLSTGIVQALRTRRTPKLADKTNANQGDFIIEDRSTRFADLIKSPEQLRLMKKSELQSIAAIVNSSLPESQRIDVWEKSKDRLRNSIEDIFGLPRTETPKAPRRSTELRHREVRTPITPLDFSSPSAYGPARTTRRSIIASSRHEYKLTRSRSSSLESSSVSSSPLASRSTQSSISRMVQSISDTSVLEFSPARSRSNSNSNAMFSSSNSRNSLFSTANGLSNSPSFSSTMGVMSPSASLRLGGTGRHAPSFAEQISSALLSARAGGRLGSSSDSRDLLSPSHSRTTSGNSDASPTPSRNGTISPSASRSNSGPVSPTSSSSHVRSTPSSTRSTSRSSWMGTMGSMRPLLDAVAEARDEERGDSGDENSGKRLDGEMSRRRRGRIAPQDSSSSIEYHSANESL